jgi:ParB-like chromosome segregation protein Spo0J
MNTELVPINDLTPDPANARKHGERNLSSIIDSLRAFGQQKPIVVDRRGVVIAGNGTLEAAKRLGWEEIAVVRTELDPTQATAFGIADNRTAELAEWDEDVLVSLLDSLDDETRDLLHFDEKELEAMVPKATVEVVEDEVPERSSRGRSRATCGCLAITACSAATRRRPRTWSG